jgi:hypothetical protein
MRHEHAATEGTNEHMEQALSLWSGKKLPEFAAGIGMLTTRCSSCIAETAAGLARRPPAGDTGALVHHPQD